MNSFTRLDSVLLLILGLDTGINSVGNSITALYGAGARKFLVFNSPDVGLTPVFNPPLNIPEAAVFATCYRGNGCA
jgi:hypothetical protein